MVMAVGSARVESLGISQAILLYGTDPHSVHYATIHGVTVVKNNRPQIGPGRPVTRAALLECFSSLAENAAPRARFLPATVLAVDSRAVTWWCPPALRRVFFKCSELGELSAVVPHPGLVFQAHANGFRVFSLKESTRPTETSVLFEPPYFNTWDAGRICIGSAKVPKTMDVGDIAGWESGFFDSAFTHPNAGSKRLSYKDGIFAFWRDMLAGKFGTRYPKKVLVPTQSTVGDLIAGRL